MEDEFGRSLGEQVRDQILREYELNERDHVLEEEYSSDVSYQDGDLPYRMQITYQNGGPSYCLNEYFPHFHYQASAALADEDYDLLVEYWGTRDTDLGDLEAKSNAIKELSIEGAFDQFSDVI